MQQHALAYGYCFLADLRCSRSWWGLAPKLLISAADYWHNYGNLVSQPARHLVNEASGATFYCLPGRRFIAERRLSKWPGPGPGNISVTLCHATCRLSACSLLNQRTRIYLFICLFYIPNAICQHKVIKTDSIGLNSDQHGTIGRHLPMTSIKMHDPVLKTDYTVS